MGGGGLGSQLQDGDDAAEEVEAGVGAAVCIHIFSVKMGHAEWQGAGVSF